MGEDKFLKILSEKPMSVSELSRKLGVRRDFLAGYLEALCDKGDVCKVEVGRSHVYMPLSGTGYTIQQAAAGEEEEE